jgi:hypothetical protein
MAQGAPQKLAKIAGWLVMTKYTFNKPCKLFENCCAVQLTIQQLHLLDETFCPWQTV